MSQELNRSVGVVTGIKATGSLILVEMLTADEVTPTQLLISKKTDYGTPQGYILDIGPAVDSGKLGFQVGDRVLVQGNYVPVPEIPGQSRKMGIVDIYNIKAVLQEERIVSA